MSKKFKIAKRVNHYDIEDFEDVEIEDDFIDENMVQIISDNEYDPMYDDCETIAVALQLAGYGKVADLEAKLAESEKTREYFADRVEKADREIKENYKNYNKLVEEYNELKQQLAESEEDVDKLKSIIGRLTYYLDKFNYVGEHPFYNTTRAQDKISFAVEQLEKVKEACEEIPQCDEYGDDWVLQSGLFEYIDNQIKQLKEMK